MTQTLSLYSLQQHFTECLFNDEKTTDGLSLRVAVPGSLDERLDIYRNNIFYSLSLALADLYPVIKRLVGEDFFKATARAYLHEHPPTQAAMVYFAGDFPAFLAEFEHTKDLAWLADVARLELAWHQSYHAADCMALDPASLLNMAPEQLAHSSIILHASVRLLNSPYPILQIWNANQTEEEINEMIDLDSGAQAVCISRPEFQVMLKPLDVGAYAFLNGLQKGASLGQAMIAAAALDPDFVADQCLAQCLTDGLFERLGG